MTKKYMKKCSASIAIKEKQIKMMLIVNLAKVGMAIIKKTNNKAGEDSGKGILMHCWWVGKLVQPLWSMKVA
jgi:hypothetical protein